MWRRIETKDIRDAALFLGGLLGVLHETIVTSGERPSLLILFGAMMGLPAFLRSDSNAGGFRSGREDGKAPPSPPKAPED